jgi:hypothetical protein
MEPKSKKRKNVDLTQEDFRALSIMAAANGQNLKSFIEDLLAREAKKLQEEPVFMELLKATEVKEVIPPDEKKRFEEKQGL